MALKLPIGDGWTVLLRNGVVATTRWEPYSNTAETFVSGNYYSAVWTESGKQHRLTETNTDIVDVLSINSGELDWSKPLAVYHDGKIIRVANSEKSTFSLGMKIYFEEKIRNGNITAYITACGPYIYDTNGQHLYQPDRMPHLFNFYVEEDAAPQPVEVGNAEVRKRVRRPKPTIDENFTEIVSLLDGVVGAERVRWLIKQIIKDLAGPVDVSNTLERIYQDARAEAAEIVDNAVKEAKCILAESEECVALSEAKIAEGRKALAETVIEELAKIDEQIELGVKKRMDEMYGKKAVIARKRAIKI